MSEVKREIIFVIPHDLFSVLLRIILIVRVQHCIGIDKLPLVVKLFIFFTLSRTIIAYRETKWLENVRSKHWSVNMKCDLGLLQLIATKNMRINWIKYVKWSYRENFCMLSTSVTATWWKFSLFFIENCISNRFNWNSQIELSIEITLQVKKRIEIDLWSWNFILFANWGMNILCTRHIKD